MCCCVIRILSTYDVCVIAVCAYAAEYRAARKRTRILGGARNNDDDGDDDNVGGGSDAEDYDPIGSHSAKKRKRAAGVPANNNNDDDDGGDEDVTPPVSPKRSRKSHHKAKPVPATAIAITSAPAGTTTAAVGGESDAPSFAAIVLNQSAPVTSTSVATTAAVADAVVVPRFDCVSCVQLVMSCVAAHHLSSLQLQLILQLLLLLLLQQQQRRHPRCRGSRSRRCPRTRPGDDVAALPRGLCATR
jgi:hypothetical protein